MKKVSRKIISRALVYIRTLEALIKENRNLVSSQQLAEITGLTDVQIRKDISSFGKVGTPRIGYKSAELKKILEDFVLQQNTVRVALFGVGNLGTAILKYPGFHQEKIKVVAAFDKDKRKIGRKINGVTIYPVQDAPKVIASSKAEIGVIAVPKEYSQQIADIIVLSGLRAIINFSPTSVAVPKNVIVKGIDLTIEFLSLFCEIER
jgi:redox-sensing transcriptional repressor